MLRKIGTGMLVLGFVSASLAVYAAEDSLETKEATLEKSEQTENLAPSVKKSATSESSANQKNVKKTGAKSKGTITNLRKTEHSTKVAVGEGAQAKVGMVVIHSGTNVNGNISNNTEISGAGNVAVGKGSEVSAGLVSGE
jgi:hypothetical protein